MSLHRYRCLDCANKIYLKEFKNTALMYCPVCHECSLSYDKPVDLLLEKGNTSRKIRYLTLYKAKDYEFYIEDAEELIGAVKSIFDKTNATRIKMIQHFGIKR